MIDANRKVNQVGKKGKVDEDNENWCSERESEVEGVCTLETDGFRGRP